MSGSSEYESDEDVNFKEDTNVKRKQSAVSIGSDSESNEDSNPYDSEVEDPAEGQREE